MKASLETKLKSASTNSLDKKVDHQLVGVYAPHVDGAYKKMQGELEDYLAGFGRVEKVQTKKCMWAEGHEFEYKVFNDKGEEIARVSYRWGQEDVVVVHDLKNKKMREGLEDYFVNNYWDNFKKHEDKFKKKYYGQPKKPTESTKAA